MIPIENSVTLNTTGQSMPLVGLGLWKIPKNKTADTVAEALRCSYRLLDSACDYGNEKEAGEGLKKAFAEGVVKREDIFVTSKLWCTFHRRENVRPACERTLRDLGLKYLDLYLIHFPISLKYIDFNTRYPPEWYYDPAVAQCVQDSVTIRETWEAMEGLVDAGLVKNIGLSNFCAALILDVLKYARIRPAALQIEHHPYLVQPTLVEYARSEGLAVTGYSCFAAVSYLELGSEVAKRCPPLLEQKVVVDIAAKYRRTPAQVVLRWCVQRGIAVVPKTSNPKRLAENFNIFDFSLTDDELTSISALDNGTRLNNPAVYARIPIFA